MKLRELMLPDDRLLIGTDLVKDRSVLEAAYNDSRGVTAEFNRNVLRVVNDGLGANFAPEAFEHVAFFDEANSWIEMRLRANGAQSVRIEGADLELTFEDGEEIRTEISAKFTRDAVAVGARRRRPGARRLLHRRGRTVRARGGASCCALVPAWERTVHCLGDLHVGAIAHWRLDAVRRDVERARRAGAPPSDR